MLAGRESLIRLVGKRRRDLPRDALLDRVPDSRDSDGKGRVEECAISDWSVGGDDVGKEWVECPVCGKSIRGSNYMVNSHLDSCLTRGNKRKLTQRTLLQLNFCTESSLRSISNELVNQQENTIEWKGDGISGYMMLDCGAGGPWQRHGSALESVLYSSNNEESNKCILSEKKNKDCDCNVKDPVIPSMPFINNAMNESSYFNLVETLSNAVLETFIVGHKFQNEVNLPLGGANVYVTRDHENVKDQHALKVVCSDSGCDVMVGYLPRELAKYLSPLVDKYKLRLEGFVTSDFDAPGVIPVRIFCRDIKVHDELDAKDILHWKTLWGDVLRVVDYEKTYPPNMMKYQRNFHIMVREVLNRHAHILEDDEKTFLGNFYSLSDDSQRIFIRLYTRKGPWFRMSNISYREVGDSQRAIEDLQLAGYTCPFVTDARHSRSDIAEILDVLTVSS